MKKLTLTLSLVFTVTLSSPSYAEWTRVVENTYGDTFYVDFGSIKRNRRYVTWEQIGDFLRPTKYGDRSGKLYIKGDCKSHRIKRLSSRHYTKQMGRGTPSAYNNKPEKKWVYPPSNSPGKTVLKAVCNH